MDPGQKFSRARLILTIDGGAGLAAGLFVLALSVSLAKLHGLPNDLLVFTGAANLGYGSYSGALAVGTFLRGQVPRRPWIDLLIGANLCWSAVCFVLIALNRDSISNLGIAHIAFESLFVATLAIFEFRFVRPVAE